MSEAFHERKWMCSTCGYVMDAAAPVDNQPSHPPEPGDISLCMNCGAVYERHVMGWAPLSAAAIAALDEDTRRDIAKSQRLIRRMPDLRKPAHRA